MQVSGWFDYQVKKFEVLMMDVHCLYYQSQVKVFSKNYTAKISVWAKYRKVVPGAAIQGPEVCPSNSLLTPCYSFTSNGNQEEGQLR